MNKTTGTLRATAPGAMFTRIIAVIAMVAFFLGLAIVGSNAAHYIVTSDYYYDPYGSWNGYKVFLSSPRHSDSGSRGECSNGYEENINGRRFNWYAATGDYYGETYQPDSQYRNFRARGYKVAVSQNTRDDGYIDNRETSQAWGSHVHIVTHTNARNGCPDSVEYLLTMYEHSNDEALAHRVGDGLNDVAPGHWNHWYNSGLAELEANRPNGDAYVEVAFHDNWNSQDWLYNESYKSGWRYGWSVDALLNYP